MRGRTRHRWLSSLVGIAVLLVVGVAGAQTVKDIRMSSAAGHTRAVIDLSGPVQYKLFQLANPDRVVIDLDDVELAHAFTAVPATGAVAGVRTGRHGKHGLRMVLDLDKAAHPKSFLLKPSADDGYRLVVDLYSDPLLTEKRAPGVALADGRDVVVVIDAGHGGVDPGATGAHGTREKDVTLKVAKLLAQRIDAQPGMRAVLTRSDDSFLPLKHRYQIARQHNADLFISIHADAFRDKSARGSSVWVLSTRGKTSEAARWLADRENRADLVGGVSLDDKSDTLAAVLLDLSQGASMQISKRVAGQVLRALAGLGPTHRGHVEHANFVVLRSPDVPSILVETGFITNPAEERKLSSGAYRARLATAILGGVQQYFETSPPIGTWFAQQARKRGERHVVVRGETLSTIAHDYGVSIINLQDANDLANADQLQAGAVLMIPTG